MTELADGVMPDGSEAPGCVHPPDERRLLEGGDQLCGKCWEVLPRPQVVKGDPTGAEVTKGAPPGADLASPRGQNLDRGEGAAEPTSGEGWLAHVDPSNYTPQQVELEILYVAGRLNSGGRYLAGKARELAEATIEYELAFARAVNASSARAQDQRKAEAMVACDELYAKLQLLEVEVRLSRDGMHTLRSQLSGLQTVSRSVTASATGR